VARPCAAAVALPVLQQAPTRAGYLVTRHNAQALSLTFYSSLHCVPIFCHLAVLSYLHGLEHLDLDDLSKDDTAANTVLNYVHAIHMEVSKLREECSARLATVCWCCPVTVVLNHHSCHSAVALLEVPDAMHRSTNGSSRTAACGGNMSSTSPSLGCATPCCTAAPWLGNISSALTSCMHMP
jgi:hypothetical protein